MIASFVGKYSCSEIQPRNVPPPPPNYSYTVHIADTYISMAFLPQRYGKLQFHRSANTDKTDPVHIRQSKL